MLFFKKKQKSHAEEIAAKRTNLSRESLDKLDKDGNLPWGWYAAHKEFADERTAEFQCFLENYSAARNKSPLEKYGALKSLVVYLEDSRKKCCLMGECYVKWFDSIFAAPEYVEKLKAELAELESSFHRLQDEWEKGQK